ncbi:DNA primase [Boudabousia liubingyangii]|uniref:phage/plasmid primase, P4 family n=1 Tax=Boudabousia liubingyangii TaxID=1921764 RepID=UPI00093E7405|nr:phage/plasmid primase, P4 family [Boudabousia liubingyangii]OKL46987.1 DNA primase [Boudabousia liubingyangii]
MKPMTMHASNTVGQAQNTHYPHEHTVTGLDDLKRVVAFDHVVAEYEGGQRGNSRFLTSDCLVMDVDNDHSEIETEWVTPSRLADLMPGVPFMAATSRNHMKPKGASTARPRFHVYLPINPVTDAEAYAALKRQLAAQVPVFDSNALDAGRFIYGNPEAKTTVIEGESLVDEWLARDLFAEFDQASSLIGEGSRNATLSRFAGRVLIRYGNTERARELFNQKAALCDPPLPGFEVEQIWASATRFAEKVAEDPNYVSPEAYAELTSLKPEDFTDVGQATLIAGECADKVCFSPSTGWAAYGKGVWDESEPKAQRVFQDFTTRQLAQAEKALASTKAQASQEGVLQMLGVMSKAKALSAFTPAQHQLFEQLAADEAWVKFAYRARGDRGIQAAMRQARSLVLIDPEDLDKDPYMFNTPGGTYDLREGLSSLRPHDPFDLLTKQTKVTPSDEGMGIWVECLNTIFQGDTELIDYVQRVCGLAAIGKVMVEGLIIAYGDGSNGKSTFWNTIARVLGSYAETISAEVLIAGKKNNAKNDMAQTRGRRLLIAGENDEGVRLSSSSAKQLASTDKIAAEKKYKDPFSFTPSHTLVLYTNHLPKVRGRDTGIWRRLIVIPFNATITGSDDVKNYADYLFENAGGAVLAWIMEGARLIHAENYKLVPPVCVVKASEDYRRQNDWFAHFLEECCQVGEEFTESSKALYDTYRAWAESQREWVKNAADFYAALDKAGFEKKRTRTMRLITGLRLKNDFDDAPTLEAEAFVGEVQR